jgi:hypothetical protein
LLHGLPPVNLALPHSDASIGTDDGRNFLNSARWTAALHS